MNIRFQAFIVLVALASAAVFGLQALSMDTMGHDDNCPFSAVAVLCGATIAHISHWQSAFASVLANIFILLALLPLIFFFSPPSVALARRSRRKRDPDRPTIFEELYASGILNRRAP